MSEPEQKQKLVPVAGRWYYVHILTRKWHENENEATKRVRVRQVQVVDAYDNSMVLAGDDVLHSWNCIINEAPEPPSRVGSLQMFGWFLVSAFVTWAVVKSGLLDEFVKLLKILLL